jgi:arylsulfatase
MVSWPARLQPRPEPLHQYIHAVDVVPTIYELRGIEPPAVLKGYTQSPIEGESFAATLTDPTAPGKETQFYAMLGQRSLLRNGRAVWVSAGDGTVMCSIGDLCE